MEDCAELHDWEVIPGSNLSDNFKSVEALDDNVEDGAIKADYFALDCSGCRTLLEKERNDNVTDNYSWIDPDRDSRFRETSRGKVNYGGSNLPVSDYEMFSPDEPSDALISDAADFWNLGDSVMETSIKETGTTPENMDGENDGGENSGEQELVPVAGGDSSCVDEKRENAWWKAPLELIKLCIFRVRPGWWISIAAVMAGIVILGRKLHKMKRKIRIIPLRIAIDDKANQVVARSVSLKAISLARYLPLIRSSAPASGATQWATSLPLR